MNTPRPNDQHGWAESTVGPVPSKSIGEAKVILASILIQKDEYERLLKLELELNEAKEKLKNAETVNDIYHTGIHEAKMALIKSQKELSALKKCASYWRPTIETPYPGKSAIMAEPSENGGWFIFVGMYAAKNYQGDYAWYDENLKERKPTRWMDIPDMSLTTYKNLQVKGEE